MKENKGKPMTLHTKTVDNNEGKCFKNTRTDVHDAAGDTSCNGRNSEVIDIMNQMIRDAFCNDDE